MCYAQFWPVMHQNVFGGRALPEPAEEAYSAPTNPLAGFGEGKGKGGIRIGRGRDTERERVNEGMSRWGRCGSRICVR